MLELYMQQNVVASAPLEIKYPYPWGLKAQKLQICSYLTTRWQTQQHGFSIHSFQEFVRGRTNFFPKKI